MINYNQYRESGIEWIGAIPSHWNKLKIGRTFKNIGSGTTPKSGSGLYYENGTINWLNTGDLNDSYITETNKKITEAAFNEFSTLKVYAENSIVIALYGATIGKIGQLKIETTTNQACCVLSDSDDIENRFLFYFLLSAREYIISKAYGGGQPNISQDLIKQLYISAPSKDEQYQIIKYLDHQTSIIDQLIQQKEKLIELLKEKRQAVINEAVTKGLDPNAKMKDSGIEWLGEVPEGWEITKLRYLCKITTGGKDTENREEDGEYPFFVRSQTIERISTYSYDGEAILTAGDGVGVCKVWHYVNEKFDFHQRVYMMHEFNGIFGKYLFFYMRENFINDVLKLSAKSTVDSLRRPMFLDFKVLVPNSIIEQQQIVQFIEDYESKVSYIIEKEELIIEKLKEYRQSIISEAVTGKIDVRDWQPNKKEVA
jgi:type I restriction enzyme S subunit